MFHSVSAPVLGPRQFCTSRAGCQVCHGARTHAAFPGTHLQVRTCHGQHSHVHTSGWQTMSKHPEFLWKILVMWVHATVSIHRKPSCVGWRRTLTCSDTQSGGRLGAPKLLPVGLAVLQTLPASRMGQSAKSSKATVPGKAQSVHSDKHWQGRVLILITSRDQGVLVLNVTLIHS